MKRILYILLIMSLLFINIFAAEEWDQDPDMRTFRAAAGITVKDENNNPLSNISVNLSFNMEFAEDGIVGPNNPLIYRTTGINGTTNSSGYVFLECFITVANNYESNYKYVSTHINNSDYTVINDPDDETTSSFYLYPEYQVISDFQLASKFAPIMHFHENNPLFPMPIEAVYGDSNFILEDNLLGESGLAPLPVDLHTPENWKNYFDNTLLPKFELGEFEKTAYFKIFEQNFNQYNCDPITYLIIQYWFYYPFNTNANIHEGDWEHVSVMIDANLTPIGIILHRHYRLASYAWDDIYQKTDNRPHIYIGGKTKADIYSDWVHVKTIISSNSPYTGYKEVSGGAFNRPGWNYRANIDSRGYPSSLINFNTYVDEYINPNRVESNYSLVCLKSLWWMNYEGKWGANQDEILTDCSISTVLGLSDPLVFDGPIGPPFNVFYNNYEPSDNIGEWQSLNLGTYSSAVIKFTVLSRSKVTLKVLKNGNLFYDESNVYDIGTHTIVFDEDNQGNHVNEGFVGHYKLTSNPDDNIFSFYYYGTD